MNLTILFAFAVATTAPCVLLWAADQRDRAGDRSG
jgi:hypothetical protein